MFKEPDVYFFVTSLHTIHLFAQFFFIFHPMQNGQLDVIYVETN